MTLNILKNDIEKCREEMLQLASNTSLSDPRVIEASKRLDHLLNKYSQMSLEYSLN